MSAFLRKRVQWLWTKQRAPLIIFAIYLIIILFKNLMISNLDDFAWYRDPLINFLNLIEIIALLCFSASVLSQIKYIGSILTVLIMTFALLVAAEATFCVLYEWEHRPGNEENLKRKKEEKNERQRKEAEKKKHTSENLTSKKPPLIDPVPTAKTIQTMDLFEIADSEKIAGEPDIRKEDPAGSDWQMTDEMMGYKNKPNIHVEVKSWSYGKPNPKAFYTTDSLGRRESGLKTVHAHGKKYALFLGCSVTFGVNVNDDQTLPAFFGGMDTNYYVYNYGVQGYGSHHMLGLFDNRNLRSEIPEKEGVAIYSYFIGHVERAIGDSYSYLSWNSTSPYYYLDGNSIKSNGNFKTGRLFVSRFYEFISKTYFSKYYELRFPGKLKSRHYELASKIIEKAYMKYKEQFGNDDFYVLLLPGWDNDEMKPYFEKLNLKIIDCTNIVSSYWQDKYQFKGDGHPRPLFFRTLAEHLHHEIVDKKDSTK